MPDILIRPLKSTDLAGLLPLIDTLGYEASPGEIARRLSALLEREDHLVLAAQVKDEVLGFLHAFERRCLEKPATLVVQAIAVSPMTQGLGLGKKLMAEVEQQARDRRMEGVSLSSRIDRSGAHAFYERLGYERTATSHFFAKML